jgi:hypothetical protein
VALSWEAYVKVKHEEIDEFFRRLLAGAIPPNQDKQDGIDQSRQLVSAFNKIADPKLRQELLVLIEIVSRMPELMQHRRDRWVKGGFVGVH